MPPGSIGPRKNIMQPGVDSAQEYRHALLSIHGGFSEKEQLSRLACNCLRWHLDN